MNRTTNLSKSFFGVLVKKQTYLNGLYLLLAFPLGIAYGIFIMTGWFLGYSLVLGAWQSVILAFDPYSMIKILPIFLSGIMVWLVVIATCWIPANIERRLVGWLLGVNIAPTPFRLVKPPGIWTRIRLYLLAPATWKSLVFVALKFPLGIATFTIVIGLISIASAMVFAPLARLIGFRSFILGPWQIDTWGETFFASVFGVFVVPLSLHLLNGLALVSGWFAKILLGGALNNPVEEPE